MFRIININGAVLGNTDTVNYIRVAKNGCFVPTNKKNAIGVAYKGTPYNLLGFQNIEGADTVIVVDVDSGTAIDDLNIGIEANSDQLAEVDEIAIELYETNLALESVCAEHDEVLIDLYEKLGV